MKLLIFLAYIITSLSLHINPEALSSGNDVDFIHSSETNILKDVVDKSEKLLIKTLSILNHSQIDCKLSNCTQALFKNEISSIDPSNSNCIWLKVKYGNTSLQHNNT